MWLQSWRRFARVMLVALLSVGVLAGCTVEVKPVEDPNLSAAAEGVKQLSEGVMNGLKDQLSKVVDFNQPIDKQLEQLEAGANKLYCDLKGTPPAEFVRDVANLIREDIARNNPGVEVRPLNISDQC